MIGLEYKDNDEMAGLLIDGGAALGAQDKVRCAACELTSIKIFCFVLYLSECSYIRRMGIQLL